MTRVQVKREYTAIFDTERMTAEVQGRIYERPYYTKSEGVDHIPVRPDGSIDVAEALAATRAPDKLPKPKVYLTAAEYARLGFVRNAVRLDYNHPWPTFGVLFDFSGVESPLDGLAMVYITWSLAA